MYRKVNELEKKKIQRVSALAGDLSGVEDLLKEKQDLSVKVQLSKDVQA